MYLTPTKPAPAIVPIQRGDDCLGLAFYMYVINSRLYRYLKPEMVDEFIKSGVSCSNSRQAGDLFGPLPESDSNIGRKYLANYDDDFDVESDYYTPLKFQNKEFLTKIDKLQQLVKRDVEKPALLEFYWDDDGHAVSSLMDKNGNLVLVDSNNIQHGVKDQDALDSINEYPIDEFYITRIEQKEPNLKVTISAKQLQIFDNLRKEQMQQLTETSKMSPYTIRQTLNQRNKESVQKVLSNANFYLRSLEQAMDSPLNPLPRLDRLLLYLRFTADPTELRVKYDELLKIDRMLTDAWMGQNVGYSRDELAMLRLRKLKSVITLLKTLK